DTDRLCGATADLGDAARTSREGAAGTAGAHSDREASPRALCSREGGEGKEHQGGPRDGRPSGIRRRPQVDSGKVSINNELMPERLALDELQRAQGAAMEECRGWLLPLHYGDPRGEHEAIKSRIGVIDRSYAGKVTVTGRDRQTFLHAMLSNEVKAL